MNKTLIPWVKNPDGTQGYSWNPITGCLNHTNGMCKGGNFPCYAYRLAHRRLKERYLANTNFGDLTAHYLETCNLYPHQDPFYPRFWFERMQQLLVRNSAVCSHHPKPRGVFTCDMSDLFGIGVPEEWTRQILQAIKDNAYDRFYLLTKQPQNLISYSPFPDNCWVGVTATDSKMAWNAYAELKDISALVKYLSLEPLLGEIDTRMIANFKGIINWLIIGAQTNPYKPPKIEWIKEIVEAADKAGIPVFLKDNLWSLFDGSHYAVPLWAFDKDSKLRQEMPK